MPSERTRPRRLADMGGRRMTARTEMVARIAGVLASKEWNQPEDYPDIWDQSAHKNHIYHGACAVCRGDVDALADVLADVMGDELARAWDEGRGAVSTFVIAEWDAMTATDPMPKPPVNPYRVSGDER